MVERVYARLEPEQLARLMRGAMGEGDGLGLGSDGAGMHMQNGGRERIGIHGASLDVPEARKRELCRPNPVGTDIRDEAGRRAQPSCGSGDPNAAEAAQEVATQGGQVGHGREKRGAASASMGTLETPARREPGVSNISASAERSERGERQEGGQMPMNAVPRVGIKPTTRGFSIRADVAEKRGVKATNARLRRAA